MALGKNFYMWWPRRLPVSLAGAQLRQDGMLRLFARSRPGGQKKHILCNVLMPSSALPEKKNFFASCDIYKLFMDDKNSNSDSPLFCYLFFVFSILSLLLFDFFLPETQNRVLREREKVGEGH